MHVYQWEEGKWKGFRITKGDKKKKKKNMFHQIIIILDLTTLKLKGILTIDVLST